MSRSNGFRGSPPCLEGKTMGRDPSRFDLAFCHWWPRRRVPLSTRENRLGRNLSRQTFINGCDLPRDITVNLLWPRRRSYCQFDDFKRYRTAMIREVASYTE
ncbi:hypothetical protein TNIN_16211 [Trichonephila inaurata madagascariensis]|uniref:Uncharacterized protein n=1 Tax=Trichonephila inaurata madagascariensis TaxID=2747483 RepID=A0A8X6WNN2_9ARAC|nr:hypothetical protein TNIN_16211 [Trichonephila inaurata madagascariensis]